MYLGDLARVNVYRTRCSESPTHRVIPDRMIQHQRSTFEFLDARSKARNQLAIRQAIEEVKNVIQSDRWGCETYLVHISCRELLASCGINIIQHFVQQDDFALQFVQLSEGLLAVVGFRFWIRAGETLHEFLGGCEVSRGPSADQFL